MSDAHLRRRYWWFLTTMNRTSLWRRSTRRENLALFFLQFRHIVPTDSSHCHGCLIENSPIKVGYNLLHSSTCQWGPVGMTQRNTQSGFRSMGIWPFNRNLFDEVDFTSSKVTDVPLGTAEMEQECQHADDQPHLFLRAIKDKKKKNEQICYDYNSDGTWRKVQTQQTQNVFRTFTKSFFLGLLRLRLY